MPNDPETLAAAGADLDAILTLRRTPAFSAYWMRKLHERIKALEGAIIQGGKELAAAIPDVEPEHREATARALRRELARLVERLDADEAGNRSILGLERKDDPALNS